MLEVVYMQYTTFSEIYHLFLNYIQDYTIRNLFRTNLEVADDMMRTFLVMAVTKFYNCVKDIKSLDIENSKFVCNLDIEEKNILANSWNYFISFCTCKKFLC